MTDPVVLTTVTCSGFILVVVFATIACLMTSSRRALTESSSIDVDSALGHHKTESLSMNTLRMKGVAGHGMGCVVTDDVPDMMLSPDGGSAFCDG